MSIFLCTVIKDEILNLDRQNEESGRVPGAGERTVLIDFKLKYLALSSVIPLKDSHM